MEPHNHVWVRRGRVFVMRPREFVSRQAAHQWASRNHPEADTMVRPCEKCPTSEYGPTRPASVASHKTACSRMPG